MTLLNLVGWVATAVVSVSYFFRKATTLRRIQAVAALIWMVYGFLIGSKPVIVANIIVATVAICSSIRTREPNTD
jgi:uncharacterized protein with PQ loop repeat